MKKFVLLASLTALAAFAAPSAASAAVWGPAGTISSFDTPGPGSPVTFELPAENARWRCSGQHLGLSVRKPASTTLDITSATFSGCEGYGFPLNNCTVTQTATNLPWTMQAVSVGTVMLNVGNINAKFTTTPGSPSGCLAAGAELSFSGSVGETGNLGWNSSTHSVGYSYASGLKLKTPGLGSSVLMNATLKNLAGTLTLF